MTIAKCEVTECKHNKDGECMYDEIRIVTPFYAYSGAPAVCEGYEEDEDD